MSITLLQKNRKSVDFNITEGFNNKIRWLIRLAYGFRDLFYLKLKIFQLPSIQPQKEL
ncbi:transposase [uncultured Victivallis sp.]|uniref:transposase n=1 Tax=uncultured Victivallis sp. TaxID=354118 RepID=UPI00345A88E0